MIETMQMKKRTEGKNNSDFGIRDIYNTFPDKDKINYKLFASILKEVNEEMIKLTILHNQKISLPNLGSISIVKYKKNFFDKDGNLTNKSVIDYGETNKLWRNLYPNKSYEEILTIKDKPVIFQTNDHFNGYFCKFKWENFNSKLKGKRGYQFKATRGNNRYLTSCLKDEKLNLDFYEQ